MKYNCRKAIKGNYDRKKIKEMEHDRKCAYNVTLRRAHIFALITRNVNRVYVAPYYVHVNCLFGLSGSAFFLVLIR